MIVGLAHIGFEPDLLQIGQLTHTLKLDTSDGTRVENRDNSKEEKGKKGERREEGGRKKEGRKKINWGNGIWNLPWGQEWYRWKVERMDE